jgi:hypothetical protein
MSGDPEDYFSDGIVEEIISALSRFRSLFVIAHNSTFTYKGKVVDVRHVSRDLGVRYVLEGSIRKKPSATWVYRLLTTTYANAGRLEEAKQAAAKLPEAFPGLTVSKAMDAAPGQADTIVRYAQGLREAGLPE